MRRRAAPLLNRRWFRRRITFDVLQEMIMKKIARWLIIGCFTAFVLFVALLIYAIVGPRPSPVQGTDRPDWLPPTASNVFHRSQEGFGWWKVAEFTITEADLRTYATEHGWTLHEELNYHLPCHELLKPLTKPYTEKDFLAEVIPTALVYQHLASNNGGITFAFDPSTSRAYYLETHR